MKTFRCGFGKNLVCQLQVSDTPPTKGSNHILNIQWTGNPSPKVMRPYIAWMNSVNKTLADEWGVKFMHVFQISETAYEIWIYEPGKQPKHIPG